LSLANFKIFNEEVILPTLKSLSKKKSGLNSPRIKGFQDLLILSSAELKQQMATYLMQIVENNQEFLKPALINTSIFHQQYTAKLQTPSELIHGKFAHLNQKTIRKGVFEGDNDSLLPALIIYESSEDSLRVVIKIMEVIKTAILEQISGNHPEVTLFYNEMISNYERAAINLEINKPFLKQTGRDYNKITNESIPELLREIRIHSLKNKDFKTIIQDFAHYLEIIKTHQYQGKRFPTFPGSIRKDGLQTVPPISPEKIQYMIPVLGKGWDKNRSLLYSFIKLFEQKDSITHFISSPNSGKSPLDPYSTFQGLLTKFYNESRRFFDRYYLNIEQFSTTSLDKVYFLLESESNQKNLYQLINQKLQSLSQVKAFDFKILKSEKNAVKISNSNIEFDHEFRFIYLFNQDKANQKQAYIDSNFLPEITSILTTNAGLWPKSFKIYTAERSFNLKNEFLWKKNNGFHRIVKSILDGAIIWYLLNTPILADNLDNPFLNSEPKMEFVLLPILSRSKRNQKKNTQIHQFLYEIRETFLILDKIKAKPQDSPKIMNNSLEEIQTAISERINLSLKKEPSHISFTIQMCENLPNINQYIESRAEWTAVSTEMKKQIYEGYNEHFTQDITLYDLYTIKDIQSNQSRKIQCFSYDLESNKKILLDFQIIDRICRFGKTVEEKTHGKIKRYLHYLTDLTAISEQDFKNEIVSYFSKDEIKNTLSKQPGLLVQTNKGMGILFGMSNSLARNFGSNISLILEKDNLNLDQKFIVIAFEGKAIGDSKNKDIRKRIERISVFKYALNEGISYVFDEFFMEDSTKPENYCDMIEKSVIDVCRNSGIPVIVYAKSRPKTGIQNKDSSTGHIIYNRNIWEKLFNLGVPPTKGEMWGFLKDYTSIPYIKLSTRKSDIYLIRLEFAASFLNKSTQKDEITNACIYLILKGTDKKIAKNEKINYVFYAHSNALMTFGYPGQKSQEQHDKTFRLMLIGAAIGDEKGELGLNGLNRLFVYPYTDIKRRIYTPAILLNNLDHFDMEGDTDGGF